MTAVQVTIAGRTLEEWAEFARTDTCLDRMVPSDLRMLVASHRDATATINRLQIPQILLTDVTVTQADINAAEDDAIAEASRYSPEGVAAMLEGWEDASWKFDNRSFDVMDGDGAVAANVYYEAGPLLASAPDLARAYLAEVAAHAETRKERDGLLRAAHDNHEADRRAEAAEAEAARLLEALTGLLDAACGLVGFAEAVRHNSGKAYPWPSLDTAEAIARTALQETKP
jgi:hypothetical protein